MCDLLQFHSESNVSVPRATDGQIKKAADLINRIDLKDFSVCQFANPGKLPYVSHCTQQTLIIINVKLLHKPFSESLLSITCLFNSK